METYNAPQINGIPIGCLMFADDVILLSHSKTELQNNLNTLEQYCSKWNLQVNTNKTKIMKFTKNGHICKDVFTYKNQILECVQTYKYLGIEFCSSGTFKHAQKALVSKASKALFKIKSITRNVNLKPSTIIKLFDQLVEPILLYGSEIWGPTEIKVKPDGTFPLFEACDKLSAEYLHLKFCRYLLGCNRTSPKAAVRGDLGRYPLLIKIWTQSIKYLTYIKGKDSASLVYNSLLEQQNINKSNSWLSCIKQITNVSEITEYQIMNKLTQISKSQICSTQN